MLCSWQLSRPVASFRQFVAVEARSEDRSLPFSVSPSLLGYMAVLVKCDKIKVQAFNSDLFLPTLWLITLFSVT